jgi:hypothetical protein
MTALLLGIGALLLAVVAGALLDPRLALAVDGRDRPHSLTSATVSGVGTPQSYAAAAGL